MPFRPSLALRRIALPWLAALMLLVQALGLVHGIQHAPQGAVHADHATGAAHAGQGHAGGISGDHDDDASCRLYDQLAHADLAVGGLPSLEALSVTASLALGVPAGRLAPQAAGFLARGPPLTA